MSAHNLYSMILNVIKIINEIEEQGMRLEVGDDFTLYKNLRNAQPERSQIYPMFDVTSSFVDSTNAFWVCGFNEEDELVHTQAIRLLDLADVSLGEHLRRHRHKYITPGSTPDPDRTFYAVPNALNTISGRVCYHGEFWLKGGKGGHRNQGFTELLSRVVFEMAHKLWRPDYLFGFVPMPLALNGIPFRYGYPHCEVGAWYGPDQQVTSEETLVWANCAEIEGLLKSAPSAVKGKPRLPNRQEQLGMVSVVA